jgi:hypothetical protein
VTDIMSFGGGFGGFGQNNNNTNQSSGFGGFGANNTTNTSGKQHAFSTTRWMMMMAAVLIGIARKASGRTTLAAVLAKRTRPVASLGATTTTPRAASAHRPVRRICFDAPLPSTIERGNGAAITDLRHKHTDDS